MEGGRCYVLSDSLLSGKGDVVLPARGLGSNTRPNNGPSHNRKRKGGVTLTHLTASGNSEAKLSIKNR